MISVLERPKGHLFLINTLQKLINRNKFFGKYHKHLQTYQEHYYNNNKITKVEQLNKRSELSTPPMFFIIVIIACPMTYPSLLIYVPV